MIVYKALNDGVSPVKAYKWPLPKGDQPGDWVDAVGKPALCANGVHGYLTETEAKRNGNQVFEMEIEGEIVKDKDKAAGQRGRLVRQLSGARTVTLEEVLLGTSLIAGLDGLAKKLGTTPESLRKAIALTETFVVAKGAVVPLEKYLESGPPAAAVARRVAALAKMPLKVTFGS